MTIQGIRGANHSPEDTPEAVLAATRELLLAIAEANDLNPEDLASIFFTATPDLVSVHPALAARQLGWVEVPLLCAQEIAVPNSLPRVIRVLLHWNTSVPQRDIRHIYLGQAASLRPDRSAELTTKPPHSTHPFPQRQHPISNQQMINQ